MTQFTSSEVPKTPFEIPVPSTLDVLPAGAVATSFEDSKDGIIPARNLDVPVTDTRETGLTSMDEFLNPPKPTGVVGLAGKAALNGA